MSHRRGQLTLSRANSTLVAVIVASALFMEMLDGAIINTSLPQMATSFGVRPIDMSIGITIYVMTAAAFVPLSAWLSDRFGSRPVFMWAVALFTLASMACGLVGTMTQFTLARAAQGIGGALMVPVGRVVVLRHTEKSELLRITAWITWPALLAPVFAPVLGGLITTYVSWRWNFLLNIPLGMAGLILAARFVPNVREQERRRLDWVGFLLSSATLLVLLSGLDSITQGQIHWSGSMALIATGILLGGVTVWHLQHTRAPIVDLAALRVPTFAVSSISAGAGFRTAINATPFLLPLLFQVGFGLNPLQSGELVLLYFLGNIAIKPATSPILRRFGFRSVTVVNGILAGIAIVSCCVFSEHTPHALIMVVLLLAGATRSLQFTALNTMAFADIEPAQRSSAATLTSILQQVVFALGVAFAAVVVIISQTSRHAPMADLADFRIGFVVVGLLAIVSSLGFLGLHAHAGAEVTGHGRNRAREASAR